MSEPLILIAIVAFILIGLGVFTIARTRQFSEREVDAPNSSAPIELLHIELDPKSNQLHMRLAERPIANAEDIADEQLRLVVQNLLKLMTPEKVEPAPEVEQANQPEPASTTSPELLLPEDEMSAPFLTRLLESLRRQRNYPTITPKVSPKATKTDAEQAEVKKAADVFAQVNTILQEKLRERSDVPQAEVVGEGGELHIRMGEQMYLQIDAVPDERVRELIRIAVAEWEAKHL